MPSLNHPKLNIVRKPNKIAGDPARVITQLHLPDNKYRISKIIERIIHLSDTEAESIVAQIMTDFSKRHKDLRNIFIQHLNAVIKYLPREITISDVKKTLIGAYFTKEYSIESAALFNPSIVLHLDQNDLPKGSIRFIMSLRATGEGHVSSIVFRSGIIDEQNNITFDTVSNYVETPVPQFDSLYKRSIFKRKMNEMGSSNEITDYILNRLPENFSFNELLKAIKLLRSKPQFSEGAQKHTFKIMCWLADSNYEVSFSMDHQISERVIFPVSKNESRGIEDARFVQFINDNGDVIYYATYTAYNGVTILPQLIETKDFIKFNIVTLNGKAVQNKGMALFPRKIGNNYAMLSRQDGENNHIMFSDNIHFWQDAQVIQEPEFPWEFIQIGNCGSPLEVKEGWLVLTHGVGPMRQYCISAMLLDLENPTKVTARLHEPLISPYENERIGYVPNVVYSCGSMIHNNTLIIPYAMSDITSGIATINVSELIGCMQEVKR